jgi:hypothetical protein
MRPHGERQRLTDEQNGQQEEEAVAQKLSGLARAKDGDPPRSVAAPVQPRSPADADDDQDGDSDEGNELDWLLPGRDPTAWPRGGFRVPGHFPLAFRQSLAMRMESTGCPSTSAAASRRPSAWKPSRS